MVRALALCLALGALPPAAAAQTVQLHIVQESLELNLSGILSAEALLDDGRWVVQIRLAPTRPRNSAASRSAISANLCRS